MFIQYVLHFNNNIKGSSAKCDHFNAGRFDSINWLSL